MKLQKRKKEVFAVFIFLFLFLFLFFAKNKTAKKGKAVAGGRKDKRGNALPFRVQSREKSIESCDLEM